MTPNKYDRTQKPVNYEPTAIPQYQPIIDPRDFGILENKVDQLEKQVDKLELKQKELEIKDIERTASFKTATRIGYGIIIVLSGIITWFISIIKDWYFASH